MLTHADIPTHVGPATATPTTTFGAWLALDEPPAHEFDPELDSVPDPSFVIRARDLATINRTPAALARLAKAELDIGNRVSAVAAARQVGATLEVFAEPAAILVAAHVLAACGEHSDAEALIANANDPAVKTATAPLAARLAARRGDLQHAAQLLEDRTDPVSLELAGTLAIKQHNFHRAIALLRAAIRAQSYAADAYTNLSYVYACVGSPDKAHRAAVAAFSLDPTSQVAGINLIAGLATRRAWTQARRVIDQLIDVHPTSPRLRFTKAELWASDDQLGRAIQTLAELNSERWFRDAPAAAHSELAAYRAFLQHQDGRKTPREAYQAIRVAAQRCNYESPYVLRQLADYASEPADLADIERGLLHLDTSGIDDGAVVDGARHALRSKAALLQRDLDAALDIAHDWTRSSPADRGAWLLATFLSLAHNDPTATIELATEGLRRHRDDAMLGNNLALALALLGRPDAARRALPAGNSIMLRATAAAIDIAAGNVDDGIAAYDQLATEADRNEPTAALHVRLWRNAVLARLTTRDIPSVKIPYDHTNNIYVALTSALADPAPTTPDCPRITNPEQLSGLDP